MNPWLKHDLCLFTNALAKVLVMCSLCTLFAALMLQAPGVVILSVLVAALGAVLVLTSDKAEKRALSAAAFADRHARQ